MCACSMVNGMSLQLNETRKLQKANRALEKRIAREVYPSSAYSFVYFGWFAELRCLFCRMLLMRGRLGPPNAKRR